MVYHLDFSIKGSIDFWSDDEPGAAEQRLIDILDAWMGGLVDVDNVVSIDDVVVDVTADQ